MNRRSELYRNVVAAYCIDASCGRNQDISEIQWLFQISTVWDPSCNPRTLRIAAGVVNLGVTSS